jgi:hypothetical protein
MCVRRLGDVSIVQNQVEIEAWPVLELQTASAPVFAFDDDIRSRETENLELCRKLCCVPHPAILRFEAQAFGVWVVRFDRAVDRCQSAAADSFGLVVYRFHSLLLSKKGIVLPCASMDFDGIEAGRILVHRLGDHEGLQLRGRTKKGLGADAV